MSDAPVDLSPFNSFHLPARAGSLLHLQHPDQLRTLDFDPDRDLLLGDGTNVLLASDVPGTVLVNRISGRRVLEEADEQVTVQVGAGEPWHGFVRWSLDLGLSGLENLSLIPGRCGAAPLQNIGAYGVELSDHLLAVEAWDRRRRRTTRIEGADCGFAYRDSRFKTAEPDRFLITGMELRLDRRFRPRLDYAGLRETLADMGVSSPTPRNVSDAVIRLRRSKLPDPATLGNAGSFFKNPELTPPQADRLRREWPELPLYPSGDGFKASAAWMIERCGWKGRRLGDAGVYHRHALVLVNHGKATGDELLELARRVRDSVLERFGLRLEPEPRILDFASPPGDRID